MPKTNTQTKKRANQRDPSQIAEKFTISLRPDRIQWVKREANARNIGYSDIVRDLIDEARKQAERESLTA